MANQIRSVQKGQGRGTTWDGKEKACLIMEDQVSPGREVKANSLTCSLVGRILASRLSTKSQRISGVSVKSWQDKLSFEILSMKN